MSDYRALANALVGQKPSPARGNPYFVDISDGFGGTGAPLPSSVLYGGDHASGAGESSDFARRLAQGVWNMPTVKAIRDAASLPGDVATGKVDPFSDEGHNRAQGLAGLAMTGGLAGGASAGGALVGAGPFRRSSTLPMDEASRLTRADAAGFRRDMPLSFGIAPEGEGVAAAAVKVNDRVFSGRTHLDAMGNAEKSLGIPFEEMRLSPIPDGFVTNADRYVSRWEAGDLARAQGQGQRTDAFGATRGLGAEELRPTSTAPSPGAPQVGATLPGLPGGSGVWGAHGLAEATTGRSASLWHRTERPALIDAGGAKDFELQATLKEAWDRGHDAVMLKNYTRPGADMPENVVVVRDGNQLRSPEAAFDPARRSSADLLASGGNPAFGYGLLGVAATQQPKNATAGQ